MTSCFSPWNAGLTVEEAAEVLDVAPDTVARDWRLARSWLLEELDPSIRS
jgi:DNA-directed RNA polymerase specialized sigma24 family protein